VWWIVSNGIYFNKIKFLNFYLAANLWIFYGLWVVSKGIYFNKIKFLNFYLAANLWIHYGLWIVSKGICFNKIKFLNFYLAAYLWIHYATITFYKHLNITRKKCERSSEFEKKVWTSPKCGCVRLLNADVFRVLNF